jgi:outer membrane protein W
MNAIRRFIGGVVVLCALGAGPVQGQSWYALTYQPAQPLSNTQDFTNNFGWRGIGEQTDEVVSAFGVDISGDQFRYVNSWPMLANATYFFGNQGGLRPFLGANVGAYVMQHRMDVGLYTIEETNVHFGFGPEAGVAIPVRPDLAAVLNTRLNYALAAGSVEDQSYLSFGIGVAWTHGY